MKWNGWQLVLMACILPTWSLAKSAKISVPLHFAPLPPDALTAMPKGTAYLADGTSIRTTGDRLILRRWASQKEFRLPPMADGEMGSVFSATSEVVVIGIWNQKQEKSGSGVLVHLGTGRTHTIPSSVPVCSSESSISMCMFDKELVLIDRNGEIRRMPAGSWTQLEKLRLKDGSIAVFVKGSESLAMYRDGLHVRSMPLPTEYAESSCEYDPSFITCSVQDSKKFIQFMTESGKVIAQDRLKVLSLKPDGTTALVQTELEVTSAANFGKALMLRDMVTGETAPYVTPAIRKKFKLVVPVGTLALIAWASSGEVYDIDPPLLWSLDTLNVESHPGARQWGFAADEAALPVVFAENFVYSRREDDSEWGISASNDEFIFWNKAEPQKRFVIPGLVGSYSQLIPRK